MTEDEQPSERRRWARVPIHGDAHGRIYTETAAPILDLSEGGALLDVPCALRPSSLYSFKLALDAGQVLSLTASVVRSQAHGLEVIGGGESRVRYRAAVQFVGISEKDRALLRQRITPNPEADGEAPCDEPVTEKAGDREPEAEPGDRDAVSVPPESPEPEVPEPPPAQGPGLWARLLAWLLENGQAEAARGKPTAFESKPEETEAEETEAEETEAEETEAEETEAEETEAEETEAEETEAEETEAEEAEAEEAEAEEAEAEEAEAEEAEAEAEPESRLEASVGSSDESDERREGSRLPLGGTVKGQMSLQLESEILLLSEGGMMVRLPFSPAPGSSLSFNLALGDEAVALRGHVRSSQEAEGDDEIGYRVGVEFVGLDDSLRQQLKTYLAEKGEEPESPEKS